MTVYKYGPLPIGEPTTVYMPEGARLVHFAAQHGRNLWVWAEVDPAARERGRRLMVIGTGHAKPDGGEHVGSWVSEEYVWHLFDWGEA